MILDGTDTFETRYILNDAAVAAGIPVIHASVFRFEGQLTTFVPYEGPCYRCLYPTPPPPELAPGCSVAGVLGVVPGILGLLQTNEALKVLLGIGDTLAGRLLLFDALETEFTELKLRRDPNCPVCSDEAVAARAGRSSRCQVDGVGADAPFLLTTTGWPARLAGGARVSTVFIPSVLRANVGGVKSLELDGDSIRDVVDALVERHPSLEAPAADRRRRPQPVRQRLRQRPGRALPAGPRHAGRPGRRGPPAPGDGRRLRLAWGTSTRSCPDTAAASTTSSTRSATRRSSRSRACRPNPNVRIFAKLEMLNPTGSVKDRVAKYLIEDLETRGLLHEDSIILEPTSGQHRASRWR